MHISMHYMDDETVDVLSEKMAHILLNISSHFSSCLIQVLSTFLFECLFKMIPGLQIRNKMRFLLMYVMLNDQT